MNKWNFNGCMTALATPFKNGKPDQGALADLVAFQLDAGIDGLVPCGSTGEAATLTLDERLDVIGTVVEKTGGKVPVIAGTGTNNTAESVHNSKLAADAGVDAVMLVVPYYNKPTQQGMIRHFETIAAAIDLPVILYNVPGRTGSSLLPSTVVELSGIDNIVAVKEASGNVSNTVSILNQAPDFTVLSGDDPLYLPLLSVGAKGLISVAANVAPKPMADLYDAWVDGNADEARKIFYAMWPLFTALFCETNPIPLKAALWLMGKIDPELRLPLTPITDENLVRLKSALIDAGILP